MGGPTILTPNIPVSLLSSKMFVGLVGSIVSCQRVGAPGSSNNQYCGDQF